MNLAPFLIIFILAASFTGGVVGGGDNSTTGCQQYSGSCSRCISYSSIDGTDATCIYCSTSSICAPSTSASSYCEPSDQSHSCETNYYTIIFVVVLCSLFCLCFGTCYFKRVRRNDGGQDGLLAPLLPEMARNFLWRNSLVTEGEVEWMCIICGFDNKPRDAYCSMCGTSHEFTTEYKSEKKEEKARAKKEAKQRSRKETASIANESTASGFSSPKPSAPPMSLLDGGTQSPLLSGMVQGSSVNSESKINAQTLQKLLSSNSDTNHGPLLEELEEGALTWRSSSPAIVSADRDPITQQPITSRLSFSSPSRQSAVAISQAQRQEAFNYRRLNQLSLRQKSARRRKMWQRVVGPDGELQWVRVTPHETLVGDAQFGYTPHGSLAHRDDSDSGSQRDVGAGSFSQSFLGVFGLGSTKNRRVPSQSSEDSRGSFEGARPDGYLPAPNGENRQQVGYLPSRATPINADSSDPAALLAHHLSGKSSRRRSGNLSSDSFGDSVVMSGSPGFTTVFTEDDGAGGSAGGWGLKWERVESGATARRSAMPSVISTGNAPAMISASSLTSVALAQRQNSVAGAEQGGTGRHHAGGSAPFRPGAGGGGAALGVDGEATLPLADQDLVSVAAMPFKEKQLWFLQQMGRLQRPWSDGCVRMEVRRGEHLLQDSVRQFGDLARGDLHKWIRVQFAGEPGIDAGGLEREWFALVVQELFASRRGLFTCSSGDSIGGTYHINPTSGTNCPEHLRFFSFAGKLFGKALMEQQMINATLSLPLRKQILSLPITFSDLEFVDPQLHRNLRWLDTCPDLSVLSLDFTVTYPVEGSDAPQTFELKPAGAECTVTNSNMEEYLLLRLRNRMLDSVKPQLEALLRGLYEVVPPDLLSVFDYQELELLMCGVPDINLEDWMRHTDYLSDYSRQGARHKVIRWFWLAVEAMSREERVRLLQFTTGCSRLPAQGFKALQSNDGNFRRYNIQAISKKVSFHGRRVAMIALNEK